ncbi:MULTISPECIES: BREX-1 system adenine-specific DNA-methyltransferase PglX [Lactococcus]|uniref:BREX-1 system adenine-specific DNA-methyltransferase PglX n=1 Tax=Lactococcus TaxID=1357 RepID=UPI0024A6377E|nr:MULTISPECIES: BREX-1 system adenine-specific DNA-methyltransferase PglX [Lactococcus]MDT2868580.1 BREX-1 system adenine-specific DNA-methyltransferase PglX [Lactococcus lactis]
MNVFALQELKLIDPSMGSGHILVYAFDVFMQLYEAEGEMPRTAAELILEKNLFGLDIDKRAFQLSYFAMMMKGRQYNRRILNKNIHPNVYVIPAQPDITEAELQLLNFDFPNTGKAQEDLLALAKVFSHGSDLGSLIEFSGIDFENLKTGLQAENNVSFLDQAVSEMVQVGELLQQKYHIGITNPPYMGSSGMNETLSNFVKKSYPDSKSDMFGIFIERLQKMTDSSGYYAMITQHAWMFLSSFEKLRKKLNQQTIINMIHLGTRAFEEIGGEVVQTTAFVMSPAQRKRFPGKYLRLVDFANHELKEEKTLEAIASDSVDYLYTTVQDNFAKIPGSPISYWVSENLINNFLKESLLQYSISPSQNVTGNNQKYVKYFWEIDNDLITNKDGWIFYAKGGGYRKWWGNLLNVVNWKPETRDIYQKGDGKHASQIINQKYWYKKGITWGLITSSAPSFRIMPEGATFDKGGSTVIIEDEKIYKYSLGLLNSKVYKNLVALLNPTLNFQVKDIRALPLQLNRYDEIIPKVNSNINISKEDWDSFETSWEFEKHPLI